MSTSRKDWNDKTLFFTSKKNSISIFVYNYENGESDEKIRVNNSMMIFEDVQLVSQYRLSHKSRV